MELSEEERRRVLEHIRTRWVRGCPMCGGLVWQELGRTVVAVQDAGVTWGGGVVGVPCVSLACNRCGYVAAVTAAALGIP